MTIRERLRDILRSEFPEKFSGEGEPTALSDCRLLDTNGSLQSFEVLDLLMQIEQEFGIRLPMRDLAQGSLSNAGALADYLERVLETRGS